MTGNRLAERFRVARREGRLAFIPYLMAGDPDPDTSALLIRDLDRIGADLIEIGVPYSDPVADGVVIQRAAERALGAGMNLEGVLALVAKIRNQVDAGLVLFTYFNPVLRFGIDRFAREAVTAGVDAVLVVDLPLEEAGSFRKAVKKTGLDTAGLLAPTTLDVRVGRIAAVTTGFLYYVSRTGVTGTREQLDGELTGRLQRVRQLVHLPLVVGFGISSPEHLRELRGKVDGVVVGSAIVGRVGEGGNPPQIRRRVEDFIRHLLEAGTS